ncbi:hypothetical protein [Myroides pelagicus]|uniref:DUF3347 domain-containing protein n=1 Tax=Myroides pelagicus TaxID=270914 RepID=A0A7K1GMZ5_9FLAO|nr:hypothetical protein [Myroides pelagicus]MTH29909.1 hypothetical protein [Myroides pelagicus]
MFRVLSISLLVLLPVLAQAQPYRMSIEDQQQIKTISDRVLPYLLRIEQTLDQNAVQLKQGQIDLLNPAIDELVKQGLNKATLENRIRVKGIVCLLCYKEQWQDQLAQREVLLQKQSDSCDSIKANQCRLSPFHLRR